MILGSRIPLLPFAPEDFAGYTGRAALNDGDALPATPAIIAEVHDAIRTKSLQEVKSALGSASDICNCHDVLVSFLAIEPETGNSPLHTALEAQRLDILDILVFFRSHGRMQYEKSLYAACSHQRNNGDSILHLAARSGKLTHVRAALETFAYTNFSMLDESVFISDENAEEAVPANGFDWSEEILAMAEVCFMLKLNSNGRTAAEEARATGHPELAAWLGRAARCLYRTINWLDGPEQQMDGATLQLWREGVDEYYGLPYKDQGNTLP